MTKPVEILTTFHGDPENSGHATHLFSAGDTPNLSDEYADLLVAKGLASLPGTAAPAAAPLPVPPLPPTPTE
ncbi:hypothetical+protein [Methylocapsa aurea]|uniref:hypothetical protein n=1 Tax=Methylocapsa aurea TaxID=663610 RepID=UPI003D18ADBA